MNNKSALHLAAEKGHPEIIKILVQAGASLNLTTNHQRNALHRVPFSILTTLKKLYVKMI